MTIRKKQKVTKLGSRKLHICPTVTRMGSMIGHRIDNNGVGRGSQRPAAHTQQKLTQVLPGGPKGLKCNSILIYISFPVTTGLQFVKNYKCHDRYVNCYDWAKRNECYKNPAYMLQFCCDSCRDAGKLVMFIADQPPSFFAYFFCFHGILIKLWRHCGTEWSVRETRILEMRGLIPRFDHQLDF